MLRTALTAQQSDSYAAAEPEACTVACCEPPSPHSIRTRTPLPNPRRARSHAANRPHRTAIGL
eukprot:6027654-Prymnesium_polylepis.1